LLDKSELKDTLHQKHLSRRDKALLVLSVDCENPKNGARIKELARGAGLPEIYSWNLSDILAKAKPYAVRLPDGWVLTSDGKALIESFGVIPKKKSSKKIGTSTELRKLVSRVTCLQTAEFLNEAIGCFEAGYYRACIVLSWVGATSLLYDCVIQHHLADFNKEAQARDTKWRPAKTKDDLARMKESDFLDIIALPPLSIIGKNVKEELKNNCLQLRNACGHPSSFALGETRVVAHLESLILNVFEPFT
jgi:hypothetical protein